MATQDSSRSARMLRECGSRSSSANSPTNTPGQHNRHVRLRRLLNCSAKPRPHALLFARRIKKQCSEASNLSHLPHSPVWVLLGWSWDAPVTMDETAAQVHTTTVLPSLKPSVCSAKPVDDKQMLAARPAGAAVHETRAASRKPVRQAAADIPKHAPACVCENRF